MNVISEQRIKVLPPQLANQIAAGEVVERPASVVKELVENSLDAGADQIHIEIEQGGQKRILIRDNGKGIPKDQLTLALSRHATSKISDIDDLDSITSMGFRGEALASISSVSRLTLTSKPARQSEAWQAHAEGRDMEVSITPAAHPDGTSIEVSDLFFNTPARRKFLRTGKTEFQHIEQVIKRLALARHDIQFALVHNGKSIHKYTKGKSQAHRIEQVCGKQMLLNSVPVDYYFEGVSLKGWCSQLGAGLATRDLQFTFVNGRMMKDKLLGHALRQVYDETLGPQTFPYYALYLTLPASELDINVHPAKHEVRFHQSRLIHDVVFKAVNDAISSDLLSNQNGDVQESRANGALVSHGYIRALEDANNENEPDAQASGSKPAVRFAGQYQADRPTRQQIKANHDLYQPSSREHYNQAQHSTNASTNSADKPVIQSEQALHKTQIAGRVLGHRFLLQSGYLLVSTNGEEHQTDAANFNSALNKPSLPLKVLSLESLLRDVIETRILESSVGQPLLMPVASPLEEDKTKDIDSIIAKLTQSGFLLKSVNKKVILAQVPSLLRQLPWAAIFPQVLLHISAESNQKEISQLIAKQYIKGLELVDDEVVAWVQEIGETRFSALLQTDAKSLDIHSWMQAQ